MSRRKKRETRKKIVLGLETSCDDTSICLLEGDSRPKILFLKTFNQDFLLKKWGGVVPEMAARNHLEKLVPLLEEAFEETRMTLSDIDLIGVTTHPGLIGPLLTGLATAKTLGLLCEIPLVPVNHLYAHLEAIYLERKAPSYPYLGMIVSGGHTVFFLAHSVHHFEVLGTTLDDAAGEAFDKGGKLMGLGYPAGTKIDKLAQGGDRNKHLFPIGLVSSQTANLSFSGLKTSLKLFLQERGDTPLVGKALQDICASYQEAIVQALRSKCLLALKKVGPIPLVVGGGVACNHRLREVFEESFQDVFFVSPRFCLDNAAMVANYALRAFPKQAIFFPETLGIDVSGRFIEKKNFKNL